MNLEWEYEDEHDDEDDSEFVNVKMGSFSVPKLRGLFGFLVDVQAVVIFPKWVRLVKSSLLSLGLITRDAHVQAPMFTEGNEGNEERFASHSDFWILDSEFFFWHMHPTVNLTVGKILSSLRPQSEGMFHAKGAKVAKNVRTDPFMNFYKNH